MTLGNLQIPDTLAGMRRWIVWRMENGRKVPYQRNGHPARSTDPTNWTQLQHAYDTWCLSAAQGLDHFNGLGYVFAEGDGLVGIDLDDCFEDCKSAPHVVKPWAQVIVEYLTANTYTEISPSGTGLKAWCRGRLDRALKVPITFEGQQQGAVEMYCKGRYFAFTGRRYGNAPLEVRDCQTVIDYIAETVAPRRDFEAKVYPTKFAHGTQHNELVRICGVLRRHNVCEEAIEACLQIVNREQCEVPGPAENITQLVRSSVNWRSNG